MITAKSNVDYSFEMITPQNSCCHKPYKLVKREGKFAISVALVLQCED